MQSKKWWTLPALVLVCLLAIAVFVSFLVLLIKVVVDNSKNQNKENFSAYTGNLISYQEVCSQEEYIYYVFYYRENCEGCSKAEDTVCRYIKNYQKGSLHKLYLVDCSSKSVQDAIVEFDEEGEAITVIKGVSSGADIRIPMTPIMLLVQDGIVVSYQMGATTIMNQLNAS